MPDIIGASLAGCAAALELLRAGQTVTLYEKSKFPRHKVCGEFLDPAAVRLLSEVRLEGAAIRESALIWPTAEQRFALPEPALGISRYRLDQVLLDAAVERGATLIRTSGKPHPRAIVAHGRKPVSQRGQRYFGYKAHFSGRTNAAVELYFQDAGYTGVNPIEDGLTNVCGIAREEELTAVGFSGDRWVASQAKLAARLDGLERKMDWIFTGPLFYGPTEASTGYLCGDALSFVDPFTGSGMLCAVATGQLAARSVLEGRSSEQHLNECRRLLLPSFRWSTLMRRALAWPFIPNLARLLPGPLLYRLSRPSPEKFEWRNSQSPPRL
ncbi:NAD(P)/FAD-dependent oxidoreductase [Bryobacter aggregatus]|uniref:NAD(P)/FAD-dependent oxidoreductase n=1 Tax=Bryobacter aggregatus TaxID=360054 RepID=UPI0004E1B0A6|nr:hypothetical protein [Bryobacter aggregatus]